VSQRNFPAEQIDSLTEPEWKPERSKNTAVSVVILGNPGPVEGNSNTKFVDQCRERFLLFVNIHLLFQQLCKLELESSNMI
jgi:hypothetical protein